MTQHAFQGTTTALPWGTTPAGEFTKQGLAAGSILGTFAVLLTFPLGILGIVLSCKGLDRIQSDPRTARKFLLWSWVLFIPGTIGGVLLMGFLLLRGADALIG